MGPGRSDQHRATLTGPVWLSVVVSRSGGDLLAAGSAGAQTTRGALLLGRDGTGRDAGRDGTGRGWKAWVGTERGRNQNGTGGTRRDGVVDWM